MSTTPLFQMVDAVTIPVPDLDAGLCFYGDSLGYQLRWRNDDIGQAGLALPGSDTEIVLDRKRSPSGQVVYIHANPSLSIYSASKAAVIGLTKSAGKELATTGVLVTPSPRPSSPPR